jgi:hypothetical protein
MKNKYCISIYVIITLIISSYFHFGSKTIYEFLALTLSTLILFIGIFFTLNNISKQPLIMKTLRITGVIFITALIFISYAYSDIQQINSHFCKNQTGINIFTGKSNTYCNFVPWYAK